MPRVKCPICQQQLDYTKEQAVRHGARRYAHLTCYPEGELIPLPERNQEDKEKDELKAYIKEIFDGKPNLRAYKQIDEFKTKFGYSYSGMLKTLVWWYDIKKSDKSLANGGIGIIPYVYDEACQYFYALYLAQLANEDKDVKAMTTKERIFYIDPPEPEPKKIKLFNMD